MDISEGVSGFVNISVQGLACFGNLAVFVTSLIRGRLDLEIGARDFQEILVSAKLKTINGIKDGNGLITSCTEETASTQEVRLQKMVELFRRLLHRLGIQKIIDLLGRLRHRLGIQKMVELLRCLRHRLRIYIPCFRKEDLPTASVEAGGRPTASNENGSVQTASVVMLCNGKPNVSIKEFMKINAPIVGSILLQFLPLQDAIKDSEVVPPEVNIEMCGCNYCNCIVFWTIEEITNMLSLRMPGTLKRLSNSLCLLPCLTCLTNGCHGCNWDSLLPLVLDDEGYRVRVSESKVVPEILDDISARSINGKGNVCICIPMNDAGRDKWTELLVRSLRSKDAESRGVRVMASEAMEDYLAGRKGASSNSVEDNMVKYNMVSFIIPRLTEVLINLLLTFGFGVDGFSSSLVARRAIRDYLIDSKGSGFAANAFLTKAVVKSDFQVVCQVLTFRGNLLGIKTLSFIVCSVNLICSCLGCSYCICICHRHHCHYPLTACRCQYPLTACKCSDNSSRWYCLVHGLYHYVKSDYFNRFQFTLYLLLCFDIHYIPRRLDIFFAVSGLFLAIVWPSPNWKAKMFLSVIFWISICPVIFGMISWFSVLIALFGMACVWPFFNSMERVFILVIILELVYLQILLLLQYGLLMDRRRWVYGAVQILVWVKWAGGSYILSKKNSLEFFGKSPHEWGLLLYSSAFFLNAVLAGVRSKWEAPWIYSISREHHH